MKRHLLESTVATMLTMIAVTFGVNMPALAQQKSDAPPPATGNVTLSLDEYNRLLALANRPGKKSEAPPAAYVLKHAELKLHVVDENVLGSLQFEGETLAANETKVPLASGLTVFDARHGSKPLPLLLENGTHTAILPGESEFTVTLDAGLALAIDTGRASFALPAPSAGSVRLSLTVPGERTNVQLSHGIITHRASVDGNTEIEATLVPGQIANVFWNTREVVAPVVPREVRFLSDVKSLVSVTESDLQIAALVDLNVVQGEAEQFSVAIPAGFEVTAVNGLTLESSEIQNGVLQLKVARRGPGAQEFLISLERPISDSQAAAPILAFKDAQRETGEVLVEGQGTLELSAKESGGLKRLDIKEVNPYLRALSRYSLQAAFRYHRQPNESPTLALEWTRFPDSSVLAAIAERATVTTLVTSEGRSLTEVKLTIRNQAQPFLKVDLPAGATILTAEVAGEKVKPVQGSDGARVPLLRAGFRPAGAYTVSFVFLHSGAPFAKKGDGDISLPKMDVPIGVIEWELFLPEQFKVKDFSGDATNAALFPPEYDAYANVPSGTLADKAEFQAGASVGSASPSSSGHDFGGVVTLTPAVLAPGQLGGFIFDRSGAAINNASIELRNLATGGTFRVASTAEGYWIVSGLSSGSYQMTASSPGFRMLRQNISYNSGNPAAYRLNMDVAVSSESVVVESSGAQMLMDTGSIAGKDKKHKAASAPAPAPPPPPTASANVFNLQQRVAGVLPVAVDVPRTGTSYRFLRPLVVNEETKLTFNYKSK
jgi:hypothetical protein